MVPVLALWLPILLSAIAVFVASSVIHMLLPYHRTDYRPASAEDRLMAELRSQSLPAGDYVVPHAATPKEMNDPAYQQRMAEGPVAFITIAPPGPISMGRNLTLWFLYCLLVAGTAAYVAGRALGPGAEYGAVFRFAGTTAFVGFVYGVWQQSIWFFRSWSSTLKTSFDGLIYALILGGMFGALWP